MSGMLRPVPKVSNKELVMRHQLRRLDPLDFKQPIICPKPPPAPDTIMLPPWKLVVNEEYQRALSHAGKMHIRRIAQNWDWRKYKPLSVTPINRDVAADISEELYEVLDGQHSAIAAATNGQIPLLPCIIQPEGTLEQNADAFIGINKERLLPTKIAIFNAQLAQGKDDAIGVNCALSYSKCRLLEIPPPKGNYQVGDTLALGSMMLVFKKYDEACLTEVLRIGRECEAMPISGNLIKAVALVSETPDTDWHDKVVAVLKAQGAARMELICKSQTPKGHQVFKTMAKMLHKLCDITIPPIPEPKKRGPKKEV